jgi:hypothetical protein
VVVEGRGEGPGVCTQPESMKRPADRHTTRPRSGARAMPRWGEIVSRSIRRSPHRGTRDAAVAIGVDFTKESDHEMEIRVRDGAHGSVRGRKRVWSDRSGNGAHAGLAGNHTSRCPTRQPARDAAGLTAAAVDASAGNPQPAAKPDGHAGQSAVAHRSRDDGAVSSRHREPAVHPGRWLVADGDWSAGASRYSAARAEVSIAT